MLMNQEILRSGIAPVMAEIVAARYKGSGHCTHSGRQPDTPFAYFIL
jgi:hypothetical protein